MHMKRLLPLFLAALAAAGCNGGPLAGFKADAPSGAPEPVAESRLDYNGYTNHWQSVYRTHYKYGNLYRVNLPDLAKGVAQSKRDLAAALGLPGLQVQEGFFAGLSAAPYKVLDNPDEAALKEALRTDGAVLAFVEDTAPLAAALQEKNPNALPDIGSYQTRDPEFRPLDAFCLRNGNRKLFAVTGPREGLEAFRALLERTLDIIGTYDLKRGWFGAATLVRSVTCTPGNPIDVMGLGMNEGNSWFVFSGLYEFLVGGELARWVSEAGAEVVTDLGTSPIYGCDDYEGLQVQEMRSTDDWLKFRDAKHGYLFRGIPATGQDPNERYDGYFASVGNARQLAQWDKPFVLLTGEALGGLTNSMVLFHPKGTPFDRAALWDAILSRREVGVAEGGVILGPDRFRQAMQLLLLDRDYLEEYFGDKVNMEASVQGHTLQVTVTNLYPHEVKGTFSLQLPDHLSLAGEASRPLRLAAGERQCLTFELLPTAASMGRLSAVVPRFDWGDGAKSVMASVNLPPAVSTHELLYGPAGEVKFPVSVHNMTTEPTVSVKVTATDAAGKEAFSEERTCEVAKAASAKLEFDLPLAGGAYTVTAEAMGITAQTQLGVGAEPGNVTLQAVDLNGDGVDEYVMENDKVRVTLLTTGARVIEYYVKEKDDNVFFKLWPEKPVDDDRANREWGFYPYGGFEDFLGQASVETHKVYRAEVVHDGGAYAEVRMRADYYGSVIEKVFTLYGGSPLLGIRFALDMAHPEMNVLGPQPIVEIGKAHGLEDHFLIPEADGIHTYRMNPDYYYGKMLFPVEGWNAAYDTREHISFVGAFPVHRPYYLHMWMNLPMNGDSHYSYAELQPWLPLYMYNTSYFSYYMWADGAPWESGLQALRDRNLITK